MSKIIVEFDTKDLNRFQLLLLEQINFFKTKLFTFGGDEEVDTGIFKEIEYNEELLKRINNYKYKSLNSLK